MNRSLAAQRHRLSELITPIREKRWAYQRTHPPRLLFGWTLSPPDFVGVGVQKAGTTWWYHLITRHPDVVTRGHPKELHYFSRFEEDFDDAAAREYSRWFPRRPGKITGEWTPGYMHWDRATEWLRKAAPDARILVMLRDPVERYRSGMAMFVPRGYPNVEPDARERGMYATQIERLLEYFPREQILVLQYESCVRDAARELRRTYRFLGLTENFLPRLITRRINISVHDYPVGPELRNDLVCLYEPEIARLKELVPEIDVAAWPSFRHLA